MIKSLLKKIIIFILTLEARLVLLKYKPKIIAVVGNVGKTSTKDAICLVMSTTFFTSCGTKSYNSEIGVPLAILQCKSGWNNPLSWLSVVLEGLALILLKNHYPAWLVLEIGADRPGDIEHIASWITPDIVIVTHIGNVPVHIEFFPSREALIYEKGFLAEVLKPDGTLIVNADNEDVSTHFRIRAPQTARVLSYGFSDNASLRIVNAELTYNKKGGPDGISVQVRHKDNIFPVKIKETAGIHYALVSAAALSVGIESGVNTVSALQAIDRFRPPPGRLCLVAGMNGTTVLDDSYNASPSAVEAGLSTLGVIRAQGRKIAVLGDMLELGKISSDEHRAIGRKVIRVADALVVVGVRAREIASEALKKGMRKRDVHIFPDAEAAGAFLKEFISAGDVVLVKGSQAMRMERAVEAIMERPHDAPLKLVRQEKEWKRVEPR